MAPSFDYAVSSLLCTEEEEEESLVLDGGDSAYHEQDISQNDNIQTTYLKRSFYDLQIFNGCFPIQTQECLTLMIEKECLHLPATAYFHRLKNGNLDFLARKEAIDWIQKVHGHFNFQPHSLYLSVNYLDRFLAVYELPAKAWMMQLLTVACVSLACKLEETDVPAIIDLQVAESKFIFEAKTVGRMELLVLSTLKWRMQSVTPFSYLDYFINKINGDQTSTSLSSNMRATHLILTILKGINFLEFRPSEIAAAAAAIVASKETQVLENDLSLISDLFPNVEKERIIKCVDMMRSVNDEVLIKGPDGLVSSMPQSPIGVLDAVCFSHKTDETAAVGSCANSCHNSPVTKKRNLGDN